MKEKNNIEFLKKIFKEIIEEESNEYDFEIHGSIFTIAEYYKSDLFKKRLKLSKSINIISELTVPIKFGGFYDIKNKNMVVIIKKLYEKLEIISPDSIARFIKIYYHEIRHKIQTEKNINLTKYQDFFMNIEKIILSYDNLFYRINHDYFLLEIDAENHALIKTEKYLKEKLNLYEQNKKYLDNLNKTAKLNESLYNQTRIFEKFNFIFQGKIKKYSKKYHNPLQKTEEEMHLDNNLINVLELFYNQDGSFKSIEDIINNTTNFDKEIIYTILSSKSFLKSINPNELKEEEIKYLIEALENRNQEEIKRLEIIKKIPKEETSPLEYKIYDEKRALKKIKEITSLRSILMNMQLNKKRTTEDSLYKYLKKRKFK